MADQFTRRALSVLLGLNRPTYTLWPAQTGVPATGTTLTPGVGAWGAYANIIAALAITTEFWLCHVEFDTSAGVHGLREVQIYNATLLVALFGTRFDMLVVGAAGLGAYPPVPFPMPCYCNANTQVQGRVGAAAAAQTINASLLVATGL